MFIYIMPKEHIDVGFFRTKHVEIEQSLPKKAKFFRMDIFNHPEILKVRVETTVKPNVVRVVNNTTYMLQLRKNEAFAVFKLPDYDTYGGPNDVGEIPQEDLVTTFWASSVSIDAHISVLDLSLTIITALEAAGIRSTSELAYKTAKELKAIRGIGPATVLKIQKALEKYNGETEL